MLFSKHSVRAATLTLLLAATAQAQTLIDTSAAIGVQNTLNQQVSGPNPNVIQKAQNTLQNIQQAQQAAADAANNTGLNGAPAPLSAAPNAATAGTPQTPPPPPLTPVQQASLNQANATITAARSAKPAQAKVLLAQAQTSFETLVAQNYNNPEPHFGLGLALLAQNKDQAAAFEFNQFRTLAPDRYEGAYNLGVIATRAGRYDDAQKLYAEAATLAQNAAPEVKAQILSALAGEQTRRADFAGLVGTLSQLSALQPENTVAQYRLALAQTLSGQGTQALPGLYALMQRDPNRADVVNLIADIYVSQNLPERANNELTAALGRVSSPRGRSELLLHKANITAARGDNRAAAYSAQAARTQDPTNSDAWLREGQLWMALGNRSAALNAYQGAAKSAPNDARARTELANAYLNLKQYALASQTAGQVVAQAKALKADTATLARAQYVQGVALYMQGAYAQARPVLNASAVSIPSADTTLWLGLTNYALKDYPAAVAALRESVRLNPTVTARQNLGSALLATGRYAEAEGILRGLVTDNPKSSDGWYMLGLAQRSQSKAAEARSSFQTAASLGNTRAAEALK